MPDTTPAESTPEEQQHEIIELIDSPKLRKKIALIGRRVLKLRSERTDINAEIQSELESGVADGIPKDAIKRAIVDCDLDESQVEMLDHYYVVCRAALGKPVQTTLFPADVATPVVVKPTH